MLVSWASSGIVDLAVGIDVVAAIFFVAGLNVCVLLKVENAHSYVQNLSYAFKLLPLYP